MRPAEIAYWEDVAKSSGDGSFIYDNWLKRQLLGQFLLKCVWTGQKVLEIGVGNGVTAAMLALSCGRMWEYTGTDLSSKWAEVAKKQFKLNVVQADVLSLPDGSFTRILALDSLEHVRPEDRPQGYKEIAKRLSKDGLLFINMPMNESLHQDEFDHGIGLADLVMLEKDGLTLVEYKRFDIQYGNGKRTYAFVVLTK
jgi:SAM-dependent methyltransferase